MASICSVHLDVIYQFFWVWGGGVFIILYEGCNMEQCHKLNLNHTLTPSGANSKCPYATSTLSANISPVDKDLVCWGRVILLSDFWNREGGCVVLGNQRAALYGGRGGWIWKEWSWNGGKEDWVSLCRGFSVTFRLLSNRVQVYLGGAFPVISFYTPITFPTFYYLNLPFTPPPRVMEYGAAEATGLGFICFVVPCMFPKC